MKIEVKQEPGYERALQSLPGGLRGPISEYVKQHVNRAMAPKPVTRADLWVHLIVCCGNYAFMLVLSELDRHRTVSDETFGHSARSAAIGLAMLWMASALLAVVMRLQTREFRISAILISVVMACAGMEAADFTSPFLTFYVRPAWLAASAIEILFIAVSLFWIHWYVRNILPTTRPGMVRTVAVLLGLALASVSMLIHHNRWFAEEEVPEMAVVPYAIPLGAEDTAEALVARALDRADGGTSPFANVLRSRAAEFQRKGQRDLALKAENAAIEADPSFADAYLRRAAMYREVGKYDLVIEDLARAAELDYGLAAEAGLEKSKLWFLRKDLDQAEKIVRAVIQIKEKNGDAHQWLGTILYLRGANEEALKEWRIALAQDKRDAFPAIWIEILSRRMGLASGLDKTWKEKHRSGGREIARQVFGESDRIRFPAGKAAVKGCFETFFRAELSYSAGGFEASRALCGKVPVEQAIAAWELEKLKP